METQQSIPVFRGQRRDTRGRKCSLAFGPGDQRCVIGSAQHSALAAVNSQLQNKHWLSLIETPADDLHRGVNFAQARSGCYHWDGLARTGFLASRGCANEGLRSVRVCNNPPQSLCSISTARRMQKKQNRHEVISIAASTYVYYILIPRLRYRPRPNPNRRLLTGLPVGREETPLPLLSFLRQHSPRQAQESPQKDMLSRYCSHLILTDPGKTGPEHRSERASYYRHVTLA